MDTSGCDVTQIWIGEESTNQTGEFLQSTHGSNGFTSEVTFGLVDTGATDAVGFLPYPLSGPQGEFKGKLAWVIAYNKSVDLA
jgi:hypothetical protein